MKKTEHQNNPDSLDHKTVRTPIQSRFFYCKQDRAPVQSKFVALSKLVDSNTSIQIVITLQQTEKAS